MNSTNPPENVINCLQTILDAIAVGNYELFLAVGDSDYKAGITKEMFDAVSKIKSFPNGDITQCEEIFANVLFQYAVDISSSR